MISSSKVLALLFILSIAAPLFLTVTGVSAQKDTPWIPQFTTKLSQASNINPGLTEDTNSIENYTTVEIDIVNQPLASTYNPKSTMEYGGVGFYYNIRTTTPQQPNQWTELYSAKTGYLRPTNALNTTVSIPVKGNGTINIQVEAMIGQVAEDQEYTSNGWVDTGNYYFMGTFSGWSANQTATLSDTITYTSPQPTATPTLPVANNGLSTQSIITVAVTLIILIAVASALLLFRRRPITSEV